MQQELLLISYLQKIIDAHIQSFLLKNPLLIKTVRNRMILFLASEWPTMIRLPSADPYLL